MMVIATGADEDSLRTILLHDFESQDSLVKRKSLIKIGYLEMNMPDPCLRRNLVFHEVSLET